MAERKATIVVTGEVSEKDFEILVGEAAKATLNYLEGASVSMAKRQTPGGEFDFEYEIVVKAPEPKPEPEPEEA